MRTLRSFGEFDLSVHLWIESQETTRRNVSFSGLSEESDVLDLSSSPIMLDFDTVAYVSLSLGI